MMIIGMLYPRLSFGEHSCGAESLASIVFIQLLAPMSLRLSCTPPCGGTTSGLSWEIDLNIAIRCRTTLTPKRNHSEH